MEEFLKAWSQIIWETPVIEYKIYYNLESGKIENYATDPLPGPYIIVDKDTFHKHRFDIRIRDGKIIPIKPAVGKLRPDTDGTPCHPNDITIVIDNTPAIFWKNHTYDD